MLSRFAAEWRLKLVLLVVVNLAFWSGYQSLGRVAFFPLRQVPVTALDHAVAFQPDGWVWVYLSQYIFTLLLPLMLTTREALRRYLASVGLASVAAFLVFAFFPTPGPRPTDVGENTMMRFLAQSDVPMNALPSLHAVFIVLMARLAWRMFGAARPLRTVVVSALWGGAICFSTLATKQHYALDLLAGGLLGWLADAVAWRGASAAAMTAVSGEPVSQRGVK